MSVIKELQAEPENFETLQLLRLLEFLSSETRNPGPDSSSHLAPGIDVRPPGQESIRFTGQHRLSFPIAEVDRVERIGDHWRLRSSALSLDGAQGPLPYHYTELLRERQRAKDPALTQFLDLFNHRSASLLWQAAGKYKLPLEYERARRHRGSPTTVDRHTEVLLSLIGLSPRLLADNPALPAEALIHFGGLLAQPVKTAENFEQILKGYFQVPIQLMQFAGAWCEVLPEMRCQLPSLEQPKGQNNCLGRSTLLGKKSWLAQNKVRISIGPLDQAQTLRFAPGSRSLNAIQQLSALYLGNEHDFDLELNVRPEALPAKLPIGTGQPGQLGWNARLPKSPRSDAAGNRSEDTQVIPVSNRTPETHSTHSQGPGREAA